MTQVMYVPARVPLARRVRPRDLACFLVTGVLFAALVLFGGSLATRPLTQVAQLTLLAAAGAVASCAWSRRPAGVWSCSAAYLITLCLFHFGLAVLLVSHGQLTSTDGQLDFTWIYSFAMGRVLVLAAVGVVAAALGASIVPVATGVLSRDPPPLAPPSPRRARDPLGAARRRRGDGRGRARAERDRPPPPSVRAVAGFVILAGAVAEFVVVILRAGGLGLLTGSYQDLITLVYTNARVPYLDFALSLGLVLLVGSGPGRLRAAGLVLFAAFAAFALPLGMRGTIMFPALAAAAVAARRRIVVPSVLALAGGVALLGAIGALREVRETGLARTQAGSLAFSPVDGLAEMGASIRPLVEVVYWRDQLGEPAAGGRTYTGQAHRLVEGRLLGRPQPPATTDDRLFNTVIMRRVGPIGGSPIAEAYYNFGTPGVVAVMAGIGLLCGWLDGGRPAAATDACATVVLAPLLIGVRNDFTPLPFQVVAGGLVLAAVRLAERPAAGAAPRARAAAEAAP